MANGNGVGYLFLGSLAALGGWFLLRPKGASRTRNKFRLGQRVILVATGKRGTVYSVYLPTLFTPDYTYDILWDDGGESFDVWGRDLAYGGGI